MNLLFYIDRYPGYGGIETVTTILSNEFINKGYSVSILSIQQQNLELLGKLDSKVKLLQLPNKSLLCDENKLYITNTINELNIDILIHQHSYAPIFELIVALKKEISCKILTVEHNTPDAQLKMYSNSLNETKFGLDWKLNLQKFLYPFSIVKCKRKEKKRHRSLYEHSDKYVLLSEKFVPVFKKLTNLENTDKLYWIPNPVVNINHDLVIKKEKILLYVGRIDKPHKRVDRIIQIFEKLQNEYTDWRLVIVGDGPYRKELEKYVSENTIKNISFEGFQSDVIKYYKKASIFCLTSNIEGWGMVLVEAMQYGVIPFSYDSYASVFDIIDNGENGFIIPSFKEELYIEKLNLLMQNVDLEKKMANKAIIKSLDFTIEKIIEKWEVLFQKTI